LKKDKKLQTLSIQVEDGYMQHFIDFVNSSHSNVTITKEINLVHDPYFYERKDKLHKIMDKIFDNPSKLTNFEDFEITMDKLEKKLEANHAG